MKQAINQMPKQSSSANRNTTTVVKRPGVVIDHTERSVQGGIAAEFEAMTPADHADLQRRLLRLAEAGCPRPAADSLLGYALAQYTTDVAALRQGYKRPKRREQDAKASRRK